MVGRTEVNEAREAILKRIRQATGGAEATGSSEATRAEAYAALPRQYRTATALDRAERLELFRDRIHDYNGALHTCHRDEVPATIAQALNAHGKRRLVVPADFPASSLPDGFEFTWDRDLPYDEIDRSEGVITGCTVAIARTGTIVLQDGLYQGRRALTLIPDYHLCLVGEEQLFETVPEAVRVLANTGARVTTFVSGPSATSDIEMTRVKGVHGPRMLEVIVILQNPH